MINKDQLRTMPGLTAYDGAHNKIGKVGQIYVDDHTGQPEWVSVRTGLFGSKETFIPLAPAELRENEVLVPFEKDQIKDAPAINTDADGNLAVEDEDRLYDYYGIGTAEPAPGAASAPIAGTGPSTGDTLTSAPHGDVGTVGPADGAMIRSEERLRVGKESRITGRPRLHKYVVTEDEQQTVPLRREKAHVEREPITDRNRGQALSGPEISEADHEVVLHSEEPVVETETVPVERVRLETEAVTENETVAGKVRKERIEVDLPDDEQR